MVDEPTDPTLGVSPSRGPWVPGGDPWSQSNNGTGNGTSGADGDQPFFHLDNIMLLLTVLVCLCGAAGNGAVVWLLRFRRKRKRFSDYIRTLVWLDGVFLLINGILYTVLLLRPELEGWGNPWAPFQLLRLGLLVFDSTNSCFSVPDPLRHPWLCLGYFSCVIVVLLICVLALCLVLSELVCAVADAPCEDLGWVYVVTVVVSLPVLCVSSLTLLVQVQCGSQGTRLSQVDVSILLTVLAFLLLGLPYTVYVLVLTVAPDTEYVPALWEALVLLAALNSAVNPVIYFLVGRYREQPGRTHPPKCAPEGAERRRGGSERSSISSPQTPLRPLSSGERAAGSELDRPPSRAAAQESGSPSVSPQGPCEDEAAPVPRH